jgi:hypothetical protein
MDVRMSETVESISSWYWRRDTPLYLAKNGPYRADYYRFGELSCGYVLLYETRTDGSTKAKRCWAYEIKKDIKVVRSLEQLLSEYTGNPVHLALCFDRFRERERTHKIEDNDIDILFTERTNELF